MVPLNTPTTTTARQVLIQAEQVAWFWDHIEMMRDIAADIAQDDLESLESEARRQANDLTAELIDGDGFIDTDVTGFFSDDCPESIDYLGFHEVQFDPETGRQIDIDDESDPLNFPL